MNLQSALKHNANLRKPWSWTHYMYYWAANDNTCTKSEVFHRLIIEANEKCWWVSFLSMAHVHILKCQAKESTFNLHFVN